MMERIHNTQKRMPVILPREKEGNWIDGSLSPSDASQLLLPFDQEQMESYVVSKAVSNPGADPADPSIISPLQGPGGLTLF